MYEHSVYADLIDQALPVSIKRRGILFFNSLVFHAVGKNYSNDYRPAISLAYTSVDELTQAYPQKILVAGERLYRGRELTI